MGFAMRKIGVDWQGKIDPEDILQEAYISIFAGISSFEYRGEESFYHWASRIIDHRFLDQVRSLRRKKRDASRELATGSGGDNSRYHQLLDRVSAETTTPSRVMRREDAVAAMLMCIAKLPEDYRKAVQRLYLEEAAVSEVAGELGRSEDAVRRLAGRAIEQLARNMGHASRFLSGAA